VIFSDKTQVMSDHGRHTYDWRKIRRSLVPCMGKQSRKLFMHICYVLGYIMYDVDNFGYHLMILLIDKSIQIFLMQI